MTTAPAAGAVTTSAYREGMSDTQPGPPAPLTGDELTVGEIVWLANPNGDVFKAKVVNVCYGTGVFHLADRVMRTYGTPYPSRAADEAAVRYAAVDRVLNPPPPPVVHDPAALRYYGEGRYTGD